MKRVIKEVFPTLDDRVSATEVSKAPPLRTHTTLLAKKY